MDKKEISIEVHCLYWNNINKDMLYWHKEVMNFFNLKVNYHNLNEVNPGNWMHSVLKVSVSDVVMFFEPDCIPLNNNYLTYATYSYLNDSFVGIGQVSNHIPPKSHIYAGPGFYCMSKKAFNILGEPKFSETYRSDVAEEVSYKAESIGLRYRALLPNYFEKEPREGLWSLSNLGYYGIGTVYDNSIYHLFQARFAQNIELFIERCKNVLDSTFSTKNMISSSVFNYYGKVV